MLLESLLPDRGVAVLAELTLLAALTVLAILLAALEKLATLSMLLQPESSNIRGESSGDIGLHLDKVLRSLFATSPSAACTARSALSTACNVFWACALASASGSSGLFNSLSRPAALSAAGPKSKADRLCASAVGREVRSERPRPASPAAGLGDSVTMGLPRVSRVLLDGEVGQGCTERRLPTVWVGLAHPVETLRRTPLCGLRCGLRCGERPCIRCA